VLLARAGITGTLTLKPGAGTFVVAVVFGYAQYLFTRLVDRQANAALKSAGSRSDPSITPTVPPGSDAPVLITTNTAPCPQVSGVSPHEGPAAGGITVILTGSGLTAATGVNFGNNAATNFTIDSDTQITATCPAGNGTVTITVTTPVGSSPATAAAQFTYNPAGAEVGGIRQP
jgi:IPT/TIG domain